MLGDYETFIKTWGEAVNSTGFAAEQVQMQLDTISRKFKGLIADMQGLVLNSGNSGLTGFLKGSIDEIDTFILGLKRVPAEGYKMAVAFTVIAGGIRALSMATEAYTAKAEAAAVATLRFGKSAIFLSKTNILSAALALVAFGIGTWVEKMGEADAAQRKSEQQAQDNIAIQEQQIEQMKKQSDFVDTLVAAREKLITQASEEDLSDDKRILNIKNRQATEEELTKVLGEHAMERIRNDNFSAESIEREKAIFQSAIVEKEKALGVMRDSLKADLDNKIDWLQNCVTAYYQEVDAFKDSISKKIGLLGVWKAALLTAQEWMTKFWEIERDSAQEALNSASDDEMKTIAEQRIATANNNITYHQNEGVKQWKPAVDNIQSQLNEAQEKRLSVGNGINFNPVGAGGQIINQDLGNSKTPSGASGTSSSPPQDNPLKWVRELDKYNYEHTMKQAKIATDEYTESIRLLDTHSEIYGHNIEDSIAKLQTMEDRQNALTVASQKYTVESDKMSQQANDMVAENEALVASLNEQKLAWADLTKEEQKSAIEMQVTDKQQKALLLSRLEIADKYAVAAADAKKNASGIANEIEKLSSGDLFNKDKQYAREVSNMKTQEEIEIAKATNKFDINNEQKLNEIKTNAAISERKKYQSRLEEIDREITEAQIKYAKESNEKNKTLLQGELQTLEDSKKKQVLLIAQTDNKIKDLEYQKDQKIREGLEGITQDILIQGNSLKNVWNNLWTGLANDALKQLFRIQNSTPGILSSILGIFGGGTGAGTTSVSRTNMFRTPGVTPVTAVGGVFNKAQNRIIAEDGEEAVIPLERNTGNSLALLQHAAKKLGVSLGTDVSPSLKNPQVAQQTVNVQRDREHLDKLDSQINLMQQQNQMLLHMINNGGSGGGVAQPIVVSNQMSTEELASQISKMRSLGYKL